MQKADDLDVVSADLVEDQLVREPLRRPRPNISSTRGSEIPRAARLWILQEEDDSIADGVE